jgi:hypothetical protein
MKRQLNKREKILGVVVLGSALWWLLDRPDKPASPQAEGEVALVVQEQPGAVQSPSGSPPGGTPQAGASRMIWRLPRRSLAELRRDPFSRSVEVTAEHEGEGPVLRGVRLQGIYREGELKLALVEGEILEVGGAFRKHRVREIREGEVLLEREGTVVLVQFP